MFLDEIVKSACHAVQGQQLQPVDGIFIGLVLIIFWQHRRDGQPAGQPAAGTPMSGRGAAGSYRSQGHAQHKHLQSHKIATCVCVVDRASEDF